MFIFYTYNHSWITPSANACTPNLDVWELYKTYYDHKAKTHSVRGCLMVVYTAEMTLFCIIIITIYKPVWRSWIYLELNSGPCQTLITSDWDNAIIIITDRPHSSNAFQGTGNKVYCKSWPTERLKLLTYNTFSLGSTHVGFSGSD